MNASRAPRQSTLCESAQGGDGKQETVEGGIDKLLGSLIVAAVHEIFLHVLCSVAVKGCKMQEHEWRPHHLFRSLLAARGDGDDDGRKGGDVREQELSGAPAGPGLVPQRVKLVQKCHAPLGGEHGEHAGLDLHHIAVRCCPQFEQGGAVGEGNEQHVTQLYGFTRGDVVGIAKAQHESLVRSCPCLCGPML